MTLLTFTYPSWLPGFLCYSFLLVINTILPLITVITLDDVATGLETVLVALNSLACIVIIAMLFYKMLMRTCVFNELKYDQKYLLGVAILDGCAAIGWSIRTDRTGFCERSADNTGSCHTASVAVALVFAWLSTGVAFWGSVYADHVEKRKEISTLPIHVPVSGRTISDPVMIHAGQFSEYVPADDDTKFTEIPLRHNRIAAAI